jgi:penicillin-binding protein-related factor A (putative recombinase)
MRGRSAERAVNLAAAHYRRAGKADVRKQATGMRRTGLTWAFASKASIDFRGTLSGGKSYCCEIKQHDGVSFPLNESTIPTHQRDALDTAAKMGGEVWLIVDLPDLDETFAVEWAAVQRFIAAPYRASLSLQWLQAHGFKIKTAGRGTSSFRIWFLDYAAHPHREMAFLAEAAERASKPVIDLDKAVEGSSEPAPRLTKEQRIAGVRAAIGAYKPKRKTMWGK